MSDLHIEECEKIMQIYGCDFDEAADMLELIGNTLDLIEKLSHIIKKEAE